MTYRNISIITGLESLMRECILKRFPSSVWQSPPRLSSGSPTFTSHSGRSLDRLRARASARWAVGQGYVCLSRGFLYPGNAETLLELEATSPGSSGGGFCQGYLAQGSVLSHVGAHMHTHRLLPGCSS